MNMPFLRCGLFYNYTDTLFRGKYGVSVSCHAPDILASRISWGQNHEDRRMPYLINMLQ